MPLAQSMITSSASSQTADLNGTNTPAGESTTKQPSVQTTTRTSSPPKWNYASGSVSFHASITSVERISSSFAEDEISKQQAEMEALLSAQKGHGDGPAKKKRRKTVRVPTLTETHLKIRAVVDAGETWELELESKHGLSDLEACVCVGLVAKYQHQDSFPASEPGTNQGLVDHARIGWRLMKESMVMMNKYPQESCEQTKINYEWKMITGEPTLKELKEERERKIAARKRKTSLRHPKVDENEVLGKNK